LNWKRPTRSWPGIYGWFTEGFDALNLHDARWLLIEL